MSFAANLKYMKDLTGLTNYQLSKELECSQSSIKNWIDGENIPHKKTRQRIADHFGITLAELDGDELPVLPPEGAKKAPDPEIEGVMEDEDLKEAVELLKKMDKETLRIFIKAARGALEN